MTITILGAGAFGTALAIALSKAGPVCLWGRPSSGFDRLQMTGISDRLQGMALPAAVTLASDMADSLQRATFVLSAVPLQQTTMIMDKALKSLDGQPLIGCAKGIDLKQGTGGFSTLRRAYSGPVGILSGPSFAADIAHGKPAALTLAVNELSQAKEWQARLSTQLLRLYASDDPIGVELGGALKNVIAIACGAAMGADLGESVRAALITRGYAEISRFALSRGARPETMTGLAGFGDLCLTCTSDMSRNYRFGLALGQGLDFESATTVEGKATAQAMARIARAEGLDMPITLATNELIARRLSVREAMNALMSRPLKRDV